MFILPLTRLKIADSVVCVTNQKSHFGVIKDWLSMVIFSVNLDPLRLNGHC